MVILIAAIPIHFVFIILSALIVLSKREHTAFHASVAYLTLTIIALIFAAMRGAFEQFSALLLGPFYLLAILGALFIRLPFLTVLIFSLSAAISIGVSLKFSKLRSAFFGMVSVLLFLISATLSAEALVAQLIDRAHWRGVTRDTPHCYARISAVEMLKVFWVDGLRAPHAFIVTEQNERLHYSFRSGAFEPTAETIARNRIPKALENCPKRTLYLP